MASSSDDECRAFLAAQGAEAEGMTPRGSAGASADVSDALARVLGPAIDDAVAAWPDIAADRAGFAAYLGHRVPSDVEPVDGLRGRRFDDLYLAFACLAADPAARRALDAHYLAELVKQLGQQGIAHDLAAETVQLLRVRLLTGERPALLAYAGVGSLKGWLRITALRAAIRAQRQTRAHEPDDVADALADAAGDPALQYQRRLYHDEFRAAFAEAVSTLSVRERNLLKQNVLYGATIDDLGALYQVHRATVARWLAAARDRLAEETKLRMIEQLRIEPADYESIVHLIRSQLDVSVARLLG